MNTNKASHDRWVECVEKNVIVPVTLNYLNRRRQEKKKTGISLNYFLHSQQNKESEAMGTQRIVSRDKNDFFPWQTMTPNSQQGHMYR